MASSIKLLIESATEHTTNKKEKKKIDYFHPPLQLSNGIFDFNRDGIGVKKNYL